MAKKGRAKIGLSVLKSPKISHLIFPFFCSQNGHTKVSGFKMA